MQQEKEFQGSKYTTFTLEEPFLHHGNKQERIQKSRLEISVLFLGMQDGFIFLFSYFIYTFGFQGHSVACDTVEGMSMTESSPWISQQCHSTFIPFWIPPDLNSAATLHCNTREQTVKFTLTFVDGFVDLRIWNQTALFCYSKKKKRWKQSFKPTLHADSWLTQLFEQSFTLNISLALASPTLVGVIHSLNTN